MSNSKQLEIIKQGVDVWNKWREENLNEGVNLEGVNLSKANLIIAYIDGVNFRNANLSSANLSEAVLIEVNLSEANLRGANLIKAYIDGVNFRNANLSSANLSDANIIEADLRDANFSKANLNGVDFSEADLSETDLRGVNLRGANLSGADLNEANLSLIDLKDADLYNAKLSRADLKNSNLRNVKNLPEWILKGLNNQGMYSQNRLIESIKNGFKNLSGANLSGADLRGADLAGNVLSNIVNKGADLIRANLNNADLRNSDLGEVNLSLADLSKANLSKTNCREANLWGAKLSGANIFEANFWSANLSEADLRGADLRGSNLKLANLVNSNLSNAKITGVNLYGTARENWNIDRIECDYFYNTPDIENKNRIPEEKNFKKGEFEELYKHLPTFEYIFENGFTPIDSFIMDQVVQAIHKQRPEVELKLESFHSRGQSRAVFTVIHNDYKDDALRLITEKYEQKLKFLEGKNEALNDIISSCINKPQQLIQGKNITIGDNTMGDNINFSGNGNVAFGKDQATVNQTNTEYSNNNEILKKIKNLKNELSKLTIDQSSREAIDIQFVTLVNQAKSDKKNTVLMKSTLESIKAITQGALGSAMGSGLVEAFKRIGLMIL